ncbi:MAG: hypothetical protein KatS3mg015_0676 [Fimbriimonadales bacterium]|nr:MAG: hypothetical protein KatS3mg015_0676 [Fimbriimonadales bacterium]
MIGMLMVAVAGLEVARLSNGIPVLIENRPGEDAIAFCAMLRTDDLSLDEAAGLEGVVASWYSGTEALTLSRLRHLAAQTGGELTIRTAADRFVFAAQVPKESFGLLVSVLAELWLHPDLRKETVADGERERKRLQLFGNEPLSLQIRSLARDLGWPEAVAPTGDERRVRAAYAKIFRPEAAVFAVVGDVNSDAVIERLNRSFGFWQGGVAGKPQAQGSPREKREAEVGAFVGARLVGPEVGSSELAPFLVGVTALMEGKGSVLGRTLRYERAVSYQFGTLEAVRGGRLEAILYAAFEPGAELQDGTLLEEIRRAARELTEGDLTRAKAFLLSQVQFGRPGGPLGRSVPRGQAKPAEAAYSHGWWQLFGGGLGGRERLLKGIESATVPEVRDVLLGTASGGA